MEYLTDNAQWIFSGIGVAIALGLLSFFRGIYAKRGKRIETAVSKYKEVYKGGGYRLECLVPAGIHTFKTDSEIKSFFKKVMEMEPHHPLRSWKEDIENIGYIVFFNHVFKSGQKLSKHNIQDFINALKNM